MSFPPPHSSLSSNSSNESKVGGNSPPKPLELLHGTPIPQFLSKTYDLVDDPSLDYIISWGEIGRSFVVWEPAQFATIILPRNFKHSNFSSFVRQLNTYNYEQPPSNNDEIGMSSLSQGFRKIDTDKWEFANEGFVRGDKHRLKTIERRKSHHSSNEDRKSAALEGEIGTLREERNLMTEEVVELLDQQRGTVQHIEAVNEKVESAEKRHKQIVSFMAKMLENPVFLARVSQQREQKSITSPRTKRKKFAEHQPFVKYQPELCNFTAPHLGDGPFLGAEGVPSGVEDSGEDERMVNELIHTPEDESLLTLETSDPILEQNVVISPQLQTEPGYYLHDYNVPDLGVDCGLPDAWDEPSGIEGWLDEYPL